MAMAAPALASRRIRMWMLGVALAVGAFMLQSAPSGQAWLPHGELAVTTVLAVFAAAMFCEYIDSSLGMGYGTTLTPLLLLAGFEPLQVVPAVLASELVTGVGAGLMHQRDGNVDFLRDRRARNTTLLIASLSTVGAVVAVMVALSIPKLWLGTAIAIVIIAMGILTLATIRRQIHYRASGVVTIGLVAAFNKGLSGGGYGPLVTAGQVVSGLPARQAVAITSVAEAFTCLVGLVAYAFAGKSVNWDLLVPLVMGAVLSVPLATATVRSISERGMRVSVGVLSVVLGVTALYKVLG